MPLQRQIEYSERSTLSALARQAHPVTMASSSAAQRGGKRDGCVISLKGNLCFLHADSLTSVCLFDLRGSLVKFGVSLE